MQVSVIGLMICAAVLFAGYVSRGPLIISLIASLAFGSTALMTLGGSSPLIYAFFAALLVAAVGTMPRVLRDLGSVFGSVRPIWVLCSLMAYAVIGALLFPRLFAGQTSVFIVDKGAIVESTLAPVSGNITQPGYFVLGGLTSIALCVLLLRRDRLDQVRRGFLLWCFLHAGMGVIDLAGKLVGAGDALAVIRTASYAMLTDVSLAGFSRIAGAYSEASAFGGVSLACLAFCYTYWRKTKSRLAMWLSVIILALALLCTSSTAYVGLLVLSFALGLSMTRSLFSNQLEAVEVTIFAVVALGAFLALATSLFDEKTFDPVLELIDTTVVNKLSSQSGQERTYWNIKSLQSLVDTVGTGIGFGSSRASSWIIAVVSQLGVLGSLMMALLLFVIVRGLGRLRAHVDPESQAIVASVRASALASVVSGSLISGTADPGMIFFIAFAVINATRTRARRHTAEASAGRHRAPPPVGRDLQVAY